MKNLPASIYFPGWEPGPSLDTQPESARYASSKKTSVAKASSPKPGRESQSMVTSKLSTVPITEAQTLFSEDHLAKAQVAPRSKEAQEICVGSGRKLCVLLTKCGPVSAYSKTLLESRKWASTEYLLRW